MLYIKNFTDNIIECIQRVNKNKNDLLLFFNEEGINNSNTCKIANITSANSDSHKGGRQVLILDVDIVSKNKNAKRREKLVYKPSNLLPDLFTFGNTETYNKIYSGGGKFKVLLSLSI